MRNAEIKGADRRKPSGLAQEAQCTGCLPAPGTGGVGVLCRCNITVLDDFEKHPHFDLWLHSTGTLERAVGERITRRQTIHDWPLSTVQRIEYGEGKVAIYKSQSRATVEVEFYRRARSPLLPAARSLGSVNGCDTLLLEYIDGRRAQDCGLGPDELMALGQRIGQEVGSIQGDVPVYIDIGNSALWLGFASATLDMLERLIAEGVFAKVDRAWVHALRKWSRQPGILRAIDVQASLTHGDLNGGNILLMGDDLRLIDWQRPRRAPRDTDLAGLLHSHGLDMYRYVQREVAQIQEFLSARWLVECKTSHFPEGDVYEAHTQQWLGSLLAHQES